MRLQNIRLTKEDFDDCFWEEVIEESERKECEYYSDRFATKAKEAEDSGNNKCEEVFSLLGSITGMLFRPDSKDEPFGPMWVMGNRRSAIIDDLHDVHFDVLTEMMDYVSDHELKARIGDILWIAKRDHKAAETAVESYLNSAKYLEDPEHWVACEARIRRALHISASLGRGQDYFRNVVSHIESVLDTCNAEDPLFLSHHLMELLLEYGVGDCEKYSQLSEKAAINAETKKEWRRARSYWELTAKWQRIAKNTDAEKMVLMKVAKTFENEAELALKREEPSYFVAVIHLQDAIEAYRRIGKKKGDIERVHRRLLEFQKESMGEMQSYSTKIDLSKYIRENVRKVKGKSLIDSVLLLSLMGSSPNLKELEKEVKDSINNFPFQHFFTSVSVDDEGKVVARKPHMLSEDEGEQKLAFRAEMVKHMEYHWTTHVPAAIEPVRKQIIVEHPVNINDFYPIVAYNPFIPPGREYIYMKGLHAGLVGDYLTAIHLLIPQLEHSIRYILANKGLITSRIDSEGIQEEYGINKTLKMDELKEILGEEIQFDLDSLLISRHGPNLRNKLSHGLLHYGSFSSSSVIYLWWLILRLCCLPLIKAPSAEEPKKDLQDNS